MFGAIASAIGGIASLFGGGDQETTTTSYVDYKRMVRMAEAAGFNPLTAIRNGGSAGFTVGTTTQSGAPLSSRIANAAGVIGGGIDAFMQNFDPIKDKQRETEYGILQRQLANLNAGAPRPGFGSVPAISAGPIQRPKISTGVAHDAPARPIAGGTASVPSQKSVSSPGASLTPEVQKPELTNPYPKSWGMEVNPDVPDASAAEDRYGDSEIATTLTGAGIFAGDMIHNARRFMADKDSSVGAVLRGATDPLGAALSYIPKPKKETREEEERRLAEVRQRMNAFGQNGVDAWLFKPPALGQ